MARAKYVWVATRHDYTPIAAFTVKHELISWLGSNSDVSHICAYVHRFTHDNATPTMIYRRSEL